MTSQRRAIAIAGGVAFVVAAAIGFWFKIADDRLDQPGWPPAERAAFMRNCIEACRKSSPDVAASLCERACSCGADEGEKTITMRQMNEIAQSISSGRMSEEQTAKIDHLRNVEMSCAKEALPAQK